MTAVATTALPLFLFIAAGYALGRTALFDDAAIKGLTTFAIWVAVPCLLFRAGVGLGGEGTLDLSVLVAFYGAGAVVYPLAMLVSRLAFGSPLGEQAMAGTTSIWANTVMMGLPLVALLYGDAGLLLTSAIISVNGLINYGLTSILIGASRGTGGGVAALARQVLLDLVRNPIVVSMLAGLAWGLTGLGLAAPVETTLGLMSAAVGPVALFTLGLSMTRFRIAGNVSHAGVIVAFKLILHPLLAYTIARGLGLSDLTVVIATLAAALPSGVNPFLLARQHDLFVARTSTTVLVSTALSLVSVSLLIAYFAHLYPHLLQPTL